MCHTTATGGSSSSSSSSSSGGDEDNNRVSPQSSAGQGPGGKAGRRGRSSSSGGGGRGGWGGRGGAPGSKTGSGSGSNNGSGDNGRAARVAASKQHTEAIKATRSPQQLLLVVQQHAAAFDHINLSAAYTHAAKLCRQGMPPQQQPAAMPQLLSKLHQLAVLLQQQCGVRELANIIHSCSKLSSPATAKLLLPLFLRASTLQQAKPQNVSNTIWAVATLQLQLTPVELQQLLARLEAVLQDATPQAVSNTLWAAATMGPQVPPQQLQLMLAAFDKLLPVATPQAVSNLVWACGKMQYLPSQLLQSLQQHPQQLQLRLAASKPQDLANMAWACGELGYAGKQLPGVLLQQAAELLPVAGTGSLSSQGLCNLCWSAAVLDLQQCVPQVLQLAAAASQLFSTAIDEDFRQLHQVHLWLLDSQLPAPGQGLWGVLTQKQLEQFRASWGQSLLATSKQQTSRLQQSVSAVVLQLPPDTWQQQQQQQSEQPTPDKACLIDDTAVTASGVKVALEVDGPGHFVQPGNTLSCPTLSRNRALEARGFAAISIPYWEWDVLRSPAQQQRYLLAKLQAVQQQASVAAPQPFTAAATGGAVESGSRRSRRHAKVDPGTNPQSL